MFRSCEFFRAPSEWRSAELPSYLDVKDIHKTSVTKKGPAAEMGHVPSSHFQPIVVKREEAPTPMEKREVAPSKRRIPPGEAIVVKKKRGATAHGK